MSKQANIEKNSAWEYLLATVIPTVLILGSLVVYIDKLNTDIEFAQRQQTGLHEIHGLFDASLALQRIRGLRQFQFAGIRSYDKFIAEQQRRFEAILNAEVNEEHISWINISQPLQASLQQSQQLYREKISPANRQAALALFKRYSVIFDDLQRLSLIIADKSNLILDPNLEVHYLIDIAIERLPQIAEHIGQIRSLSINLLSNTSAQSEINTLIKNHIFAMEKDLQRLHKGYDVIYTTSERNAGKGFEIVALSEGIKEFFHKVKSMPAANNQTQATRTLFNEASSLIDKINQMFINTTSHVTDQISERLNTLTRLRNSSLLGSVIALLLMIFLITHFYISNRRAFQHVTQARRDAAEAEIRQRTILEKMIDGVITIDEKGIINSINQAGEQIFGYPASELIGKNIKIIMPSPYHEEHDRYIENYLNTGKAKIIGGGCQVKGLRKDGTTFPLDLAVNELTINGQRMFSGIVRDITERKRIEKMKNEFISTVSHELRTPLTSIRGSLGLVMGGTVGELPEPVKEMLNIAANNTERLLLLINDILDIQKIESGMMAFHFHDVALKPFLQQAILANQAYAEQYRVQFILRHIDEPVSVYADEDRLMQVMNNLLSNAAKFSPKGEPVEISLACHEGMIRISISDHGNGIPEGFHTKLFDKFTQSDSTDARQKGGTGLGLNIARLIVEKHGGRLDFITKQGVGSTFYFDLPQLVADLNLADLPLTLTEKHTPCILVVEDDHDIAALLQRMLAEAGFNTDIAYSAGDARRLLRERGSHYKAMTLDINLPDEDGIDMFNKLRQDDTTRELPVIIISAYADGSKKRLNGGAVGILDWLNKPIDQERLQRVVQQAAGRTKRPRVLHVEDEQDIHLLVSKMLQQDCELIWTSTLAASQAILAEEEFDIVLLDIGLPDGSGLELLKTIERSTRPPRVVIFSAQNVDHDIAKQVNAVLIKSQTSNDKLLKTITSAINAH